LKKKLLNVPQKSKTSCIKSSFLDCPKNLAKMFHLLETRNLKYI
jgi:hypothetical protein